MVFNIEDPFLVVSSWLFVESNFELQIPEN